MLQRMRRGYSREAYDALVTRVRQVIPHIALSTDIITGGTWRRGGRRPVGGRGRGVPENLEKNGCEAVGGGGGQEAVRGGGGESGWAPESLKTGQGWKVGDGVASERWWSETWYTAFSCTN